MARPSLNLTDQFNWLAMPADTVRAITAAPGLLKQVSYRPSQSAVLRRRVHGMPDRIQDLAQRFAADKITAEGIDGRGLAPIEQARALELALDYLAYQKVSDEGFWLHKRRGRWLCSR